jgi:hypothetical protein
VITLRIFHPGRLVLPLGRGGSEEPEERWLVLHRHQVGWAEVLGACLQLMFISADPVAGGLRLNSDAGTISWQQGTMFSILWIRIRGFSHKKHKLILAALRKAARFQ